MDGVDGQHGARVRPPLHSVLCSPLLALRPSEALKTNSVGKLGALSRAAASWICGDFANDTLPRTLTMMHALDPVPTEVAKKSSFFANLLRGGANFLRSPKSDASVPR